MARIEGQHLGVCYYPEHWPEERWADDARRMAELGLSYVRIGEFAWSRLEPEAGRYDFAWLRRAIDVLYAAGLKVVLGTPTATPPKWLVDRMPDMLPVDREGRVRGFGSRRHYCFSHEGYREECRRIVTALARDFGTHPAVAAWQTDNEYDCHDTTLSYSASALTGFRNWLSRKYQSPDALNRAWGNVFWSMEYASFDEVELPNQTVTEANPAHWMDFRRYASEQVVTFNRLQVAAIRAHSPGRAVIHNFMGRTLAFDHFEVGADLDVSSWDSYPLGFLDDRSDRDEAFRLRYMRAGDPDFQALHHDLYRATSGGRWWIMEQQPGPVNWAPHNPVPRDGMVRLWTFEAFAHGAEVVSYFRWRQAPFAQEQMHSGLLRPDSVEARGFVEAASVIRDLDIIGTFTPVRARVALVFDYPSAWAWAIQPQGRSFDYFALVFDVYKALRALGLDVDITPATDPDLEERDLVLVPGLFAWPDALRKALAVASATVLIGPRSGSKTENFSIPAGLPPDLPDLIDFKISRVESLRAGASLGIAGHFGKIGRWREFIELGATAETFARTEDGHPLIAGTTRLRYLAGWPDEEAMRSILRELAEAVGLEIRDLPEGVRMRRLDRGVMIWNYSDETVDLLPVFGAGPWLLDGPLLPPSGVAFLPVSSR